MFGFGFQEIMIIMLLLLFVFGAKRLPEIGSGIGKGIKNFKKSLSDTEAEADKIEDNKDNAEKK